MSSNTFNEDFATVCLHNLIALNTASILQEDIDDEVNLKCLAEKHTRKFLHQVYQLESASSDEGRVFQLSKEHSYLLPRQLTLPSGTKEKSRWEKFAEKNRIQKRKHHNLVWDTTMQDWQPRWLSKRRRKEQEDTAIFELKDNESLRESIARVQESRLLKKNKSSDNKRISSGKTKQEKKDLTQSDLVKLGRHKSSALVKTLQKKVQTSTASHGKYPLVKKFPKRDQKKTKKRQNS